MAGKKTTPTDDSDDERRQRVLAAAFQAFTRNGYAGTSTLEIATRANVSKRDLYALFDSKQAMLAACIRSRSARMQLPGGLPAPNSPKALAATLTAFGANLLTESSHPAVVAMFRLAIAEADRSPEVAKTLENSRAANRRTLAEFLAAAQSQNLLPAGNPADMASRYFALLGGDLMMSLLLGTAPRPNKAQIDRQAAEATETFLRLYAV